MNLQRLVEELYLIRLVISRVYLKLAVLSQFISMVLNNSIITHSKQKSDKFCYYMYLCCHLLMRKKQSRFSER